MKRYGVLALIAMVATVAYCQGSAPPPVTAPPPAAKVKTMPPPSTAEVDASEVARWGDRVSVAGEGPRAGEEVLFTQAMGTPPDDSHCWFVTLWGNSKDPATEALRKAFEKDDNLTPFVAIPPGKETPWAHFNTYYSDDGSQAFRFKTWKMPADLNYPIVTVSPPRNGKFNFNGKYAVVAVIPYGAVPGVTANQVIDTPEKLKKQITGMVALYCKRLQESGGAPRYDEFGHRSLPPADVYGHRNDTDVPPPGGIGQRSSYTAPFPSPPIQQGFNPSFPFNPAPAPVTPTVNPTTPGAPLSFMELQALLPGAPPEFVYQQLAAGASNPQAVVAAYQVYLMQQNQATPGGGLSNWLTTGLGALAISLVTYFVTKYKTKVNAEPGNQPGERAVNLLDALLTAFRNGSGVTIRPAPSQTPAPASSPAVVIVPDSSKP